MIRRSDVIRTSIAQVRTMFPPRVFDLMRSVQLRCGEVTVEVGIAVVAEPSCRSGQRRWLRCPACSKRTNVVGFFASDPRVFGCRRCLGWRES